MEVSMTTKKMLNDIKQLVEDNLGQEISFEIEKGKKRAKLSMGVLDAAFDSVFTVVVDKGTKAEHTTSFSYTDLLIDTVEIILLNSEEKLCLQ